MHVIVLGSGVIGTTTAWYLAEQGAKVTVLDRKSAVGMETSFANAGQVSPGYSTPWAAPGIPLKAVKWLMQRHAPLSIRPDGSLFQWQWMLQMLLNCNADRYAVNKERMLRVSAFSRECLIELRETLGLDYEQRSRGLTQLFRSEAQFDAAVRDIDVLEACGIEYELLEGDKLGIAEPALLRDGQKLAGGLRLPNDETGDCHSFTTQLAEHARAAGVDFKFDVDIDGMRVEDGVVQGMHVCIDGRKVLLRADRYVIALGSYSRPLAKSIGLDLPVYPVKGYSLTVPLLDADAAPVSTVLDETYKVAVTRFNDRVRVGGMAELAGYGTELNPRRRETLEMVLEDLYPGCGDLEQGEFWSGLRPMTPDSTPIIGETAIPGVFLNTGHGTLGWTMACGSAKLLSDIVVGKRPTIRCDDLSLSRYGRKAYRRPREWSPTPA